jgi:DNA-binding transcriptional LysR family regulator
MGNNLTMQVENKSMQYVVAIERHQSITKAAAEMYISQPSLSKFLKSLEDRLGFKIFNRLGSHLMPTLEGEVYIEYAKRICEMENRMLNELTSIIHSNRGRLRLALPSLRSAHILPYVIPKFHDMYPGVELQIFERHSRFLKQILLDGSVDFAVLNTEVINPNIHEELLRCDEVLLVVPPEHPLCNQGIFRKNGRYPQIDIELFRDAEFILQPAEQRTRQIADEILGDAKIKPKVLFTTYSLETALKTVAQGCGVCFAAEAYIKHSVLPRQPHYFAIGHPSARVVLNLAYIKGVYQPAYFEDFMQILRNAVVFNSGVEGV